MNDGIKNFYDPDPVICSPDLIAVQAGIKKTSIWQSSVKNFEKAKPFFRKHDLEWVVADKGSERLRIYLSGSKDNARAAKEADSALREIQKEPSREKKVDLFMENLCMLGRLLSYPDCCVHEYVKNRFLEQNDLADCATWKSIPEKIDFYFNNFLHGASNHFLSFHVPCSFFCQKTKKYSQKIFTEIEKASPVFAREIKKNLRRPYLVFMNGEYKDGYISWDHRECFLFEGVVEGKKIAYSGVLRFKTDYRDFERRKESEEKLMQVAELIGKGNEIIFDEGGFKVLKNSIFLGQFARNKLLGHYLFNFQ